MMKRILTTVLAFCLLFTISACSTEVQAERAPSEDTTSSPLSKQPGSSGFTDVPDGAWYAEAAAWCRVNGIMQGTSDITFSPNKALSRVMLATILYRVSGSPAVFADLSFQDTKQGTWYSDAVVWAAENEILTGYGNRMFGVEDPVTREQFAVILWRYAGFPSSGTMEAASDADDISSWALESVAWARSNGIIADRDNGRFDPAAGVTRAEAAMFLYNFLNTFMQNEEQDKISLPYDGIYPQHEPYGTGIGAMPGRVVWAHDSESVSWDGSGYWWELDHFDEMAILNMVNDSISSLGGKATAKDGWTALFQAHNGGTGYQAGEKIAIKANINGSAVYDDDTSGETQMSYTNPVLLKALLRSMVEEAGVQPTDITVYDVSRLFPDYMVELCTTGNLRGVNFVGRDNGVADQSTPIQWSYQFSGKVNYLPTCVTEAEYVINLANLKGHSYGITLCGKNHFGSFINGNAMRPPEGANLHQWLTRNEMGIYSPLVDLMANAGLGGKTVLYMLDAIICAPSEGASITGDNSRWQQSPFNGHYTASVFISQDPVAIDSVGADFLMNEPTVTSRNGSLRDNPAVENYLHEAALAGQTPSGTIYTDSQGHTVTNLGVHEHWNNSTSKQYSRNLGKAEGIELIYLKE